MWCHIQYPGDIFVSRDSNFFKGTKIGELQALGAHEILAPSDALRRIESEP